MHHATALLLAFAVCARGLAPTPPQQRLHHRRGWLERALVGTVSAASAPAFAADSARAVREAGPAPKRVGWAGDAMAGSAAAEAEPVLGFSGGVAAGRYMTKSRATTGVSLNLESATTTDNVPVEIDRTGRVTAELLLDRGATRCRVQYDSPWGLSRVEFSEMDNRDVGVESRTSNGDGCYLMVLPKAGASDEALLGAVLASSSRYGAYGKSRAAVARLPAAPPNSPPPTRCAIRRQGCPRDHR